MSLIRRFLTNPERAQPVVAPQSPPAAPQTGAARPQRLEATRVGPPLNSAKTSPVCLSPPPAAQPAAAPSDDGLRPKCEGEAIPVTVKKTVSLEELVDLFLQSDVSDTTSRLQLGKLAQSWLRDQPDRKTAIAAAKCALIAAGVCREKTRIDRLIKTYWAARVFGAIDGKETLFGTAAAVPISVLYALLPLVSRDDKKHQWRLREKTAEQARDLWRRIPALHFSARDVAEEVKCIRPRKSRQPRKSNAKAKILRLMPKLVLLELEELLTAFDEKKRSLEAGAAARAA